jgi:hypothetical protein
MKSQPKVDPAATSPLIKADPNLPALIVTGHDSISIRKGTHFHGAVFDQATPISLPALEPGADYAVTVNGGSAAAFRLDAAPAASSYIGGFHFAPGGNAPAREGGDEIPAINPCSLWDVNFRPTCADPRGMALVEMRGLRFWCDIYLAGAKLAADGTSKFGAIIADGDDRPIGPDGKKYKRFDYEAARAVMAAHGKGLLGVEEFFAAAFGVTERTVAARDPKITGLDSARTSKFGLMQATGNLWVWGHDGDPDQPRASMFGGSWHSGGGAGSRFASVATHWPEFSSADLGARGRSDHLQLA